MIRYATKTEINFPTLSVIMYTENTDCKISLPVAIKPAASMEAPPPVAPPKKNTVIGVAVIVPTSASIMPEMINFQIFVIML